MCRPLTSALSLRTPRLSASPRPLSPSSSRSTRRRCALPAPHRSAKMPHLPLMQWDFKDELSATSRQFVNAGAPETTFYDYDAGGQRARKITERQNGSRKDERFYVGGFEVYREFSFRGGLSFEGEALAADD